MPKGICVGVLPPDQGSHTCAKGIFKCLKIIFDRTSLYSRNILYTALFLAVITVPYSSVSTSMSSAFL